MQPQPKVIATWLLAAGHRDSDRMAEVVMEGAGEHDEPGSPGACVARRAYLSSKTRSVRVNAPAEKRTK
jgi:hypothetical protein